MSEQFDVAQHYTMIGFLAGAVFPSLALEWWRQGSGASVNAPKTAGLLWVLVLAVAPMSLAVTLNDRGVIGYLMGLGMAPVLDAIRGEKSPQALSLSMGLAGAMTVGYGWIAPHLDLDRHGKIVWLAWIVIPLLVVIAAIATLSNRSESRTVGAKA